ncbi:histidine kinase [Nostoc sp. 'Peltigera membranacea cyanobiont' 210A]|uniref:NACHT domain-containing protein n=1 Tax=Nostoc sp. 'Peltigera membranacea cyanobiont' 210A TaxID=2014529 RepID=UPI000B95C64D|nr:NACHT domain-containing NTPase [Nostoc sp. 'Peltigera membranacea cyanobiont' 210A]OYD92647.1 histidine kinase [Nostoc sp. 'Peltigera membranacea cyanobiont' 210A]
MARRSLKASTVGIEKAKKAFKIREWTQEYLASEIGLETRQPIWKFFTGKPIERQNFMEICFRLGLDWQDIAELPNPRLLTENNQEWEDCQNVESLVQMLRSRLSDKIKSQCATTRLLDIDQPIQLEEIYVSTNILNNITSRRWLDILDLQGLITEEFDCFNFNQLYQERASAIQAVITYPKLMVLGKPGSGKTTFLQYIAMQCNQGKLLSDRIPIFIRLKNFAEDARETGNYSLLNYLSQELADCGASDQEIQTLLVNGRILILLDGLDEIPEEDNAKIISKIRSLAENYYKNKLIITCRIGYQQYHFEEFSDVEIADFDYSQIEAFVQNWFVNVSKNSIEKGKALACQFMQKLQFLENQQIRELAVRPLLLNLACCVFQARSDFPVRRVEFYKQGLDILLNRWDKVRSIKRDEIYLHLSLAQKLELLSQIAAITFKQGHYFFTQSIVEQYITDYLCNLNIAQTEPEMLQLNSEAVLRLLETHGLLIEQARGIYSFSHIAFQEYLTAKNIITSPNPQILEKKLIDLVSHLTEPRWRKIFLLIAGMLDNPTCLLQLMKQQLDRLVAFDQQLENFFNWLNHKSLSVQSTHKRVAIRAFYLTLELLDDLSLTNDLAFSLGIDLRLTSNLTPDLALDIALQCALHLSVALSNEPTLDRVLALSFALPDRQTLVCNSELQSSLQKLKEQLPTPVQGREKLKEWWNSNGQIWADELRLVIIRCRNIGHQWHFSEQQKEILKQYYTASQLLVDCLNSACKATPTIPESLLATLLLPTPKILMRNSIQQIYEA